MINILIHYTGLTNDEFKFDAYIDLDFIYTNNKWVLDVYTGYNENSNELRYTYIFNSDKNLTHEEAIRIFETVILFRLYPDCVPTFEYEEISFYADTD